MMTRLLLALVLFLVCPILSFAELQRHSTIELPESVFNFGTVAEGTKISHDFVIKNSGNQPLQILKAIPSCGCTTSSITNELIEAGQSSNLHVEFDTTGFSGEKTKTVSLLTNDPFNEQVTLTLKGVVQQNIKVEPAQVFLPEVIHDGQTLKNASAEVTITVNPENATTLKIAKSFSKNLKISELNSSPKSKTLKIELLASVTIGDFRDVVAVMLEGSNQPELRIPVFAKVSGPLKLSANIVSFGLVDGSSVDSKSIKLDNHGSKSISIISVESTDPAIIVDTKEITKGQAFVIQLKLNPQLLTKDLRSVVRIFTSQSNDPLVINVVAVLPPKS